MLQQISGQNKGQWVLGTATSRVLGTPCTHPQGDAAGVYQEQDTPPPPSSRLLRKDAPAPPTPCWLPRARPAPCPHKALCDFTPSTMPVRVLGPLPCGGAELGMGCQWGGDTLGTPGPMATWSEGHRAELGGANTALAQPCLLLPAREPCIPPP